MANIPWDLAIVCRDHLILWEGVPCRRGLSLLRGTRQRAEEGGWVYVIGDGLR